MSNGEVYHYFYDGNGNVAQLVKASDGSIAAHYEYDPYGNIIAKSGPLADDNPIRYSTKFFDNETGLGYWGYRFYSPALGRWINRDPLGEEGGINLYGFVGNNPINRIDPKGLQQITGPGAALENAILAGEWAQAEEIAEIMKLSGSAVVAAIIAARSKAKQVPVPLPVPIEDTDDTNKNCIWHLKRCLETSLADEPGSVCGQTRCAFCYEVCKRNQGWPDRAPTTTGSVTCNYGLFPKGN